MYIRCFVIKQDIQKIKLMPGVLRSGENKANLQLLMIENALVSVVKGISYKSRHISLFLSACAALITSTKIKSTNKDKPCTIEVH